MKTLTSLLLLGLLTFTSCQDENNKPDPAILSGTITNHQDRILKMTDFFGKGEWRQVVNVIDSTFTLNLDLEKPIIRLLEYDMFRQDIFLEPHKTLEINFDANNVEESFNYAGDLAMENYILDSVARTMNDGVDYKFLISQDPNVITKVLDSIKNESRAFLQRLKNSDKTSSDFVAYTNAFIDYNIASTKIFLGGRKDTLPEDYYDFMSDLSLTEPDLLEIPEYRRFLYAYINKESNLRVSKLDSVEGQSPDADFLQSLEVINELENDDIRAYSLYNAMVVQLMYSGIKDFDKHYDYFKSHNTDPYYQEQLEKLYNEKNEMAPGKSAPDFTLMDINDDEKSLSDFNGQYVLLEFGNSKCGICRRELPHFMELQSEYENENIAFVSIYNDPDTSEWKTYIKDKRNVGTNLWTDKFWDSEIFKAYQVSGTPTYVLLDKSGNIIDPVAPSPSSKEIRQYLNEILEVQ